MTSLEQFEKQSEETFDAEVEEDKSSSLPFVDAQVKEVNIGQQNLWLAIKKL